MAAASQKLLSLVGVANLATRWHEVPVAPPLGGLGRRQSRCRPCTDNWFPNPPGDDTTQKPVEKKMAVPTDNDAETPAARAQIRNNNE